MKIFIWNELKEVSDNYHAEGGLLIIAESIKRAEEIAKYETGKFNFESNNYDKSMKKISLRNKENIIINPDYEFDTSHTEEKVIIFPNAGCC